MILRIAAEKAQGVSMDIGFLTNAVMTQRIGQRFEFKLGKMTFRYKIKGIEKAGNIVTDDSYYGTKYIIYGDLLYTDVWYCDIEAFEAAVANGRYKQIK